TLWTSLVWEIDSQNRSGNLQLTVDLTEGMTLQLSHDIQLRVLAPRKALALLGPGGKDNRGTTIETNTISAVIRVEVQGQAIALLSGDIDMLGLGHLLKPDRDPRSTIHIDSAMAAGRLKGRCCAGSIVVSLVATGGIIPDRLAHERFIRVAAPTALCQRVWRVAPVSAPVARP